MSVLYTLLITPVEYIIEFIYVFLERRISNPGIVIVFVSLSVNLLVLPIYLRADTIQAEENEKQRKMEMRVKQIRGAFSGDEQFMMLQTYYREMNYKPFFALRTILPTLLQIPFFIAAFHFLSNLDGLKGIAFGPISDLSKPDQLLCFGGIYYNLLPLLMTLINIFSTVVYMRSNSIPLRNQLQAYGLAIFFLLLLYKSPSCLVFYWTCNNLFSFVKNIIMNYILKKHGRIKLERENTENDRIYLSQILLTVLLGLVIPSALVASSTTEFVILADPKNPIHYVINTCIISVGYFLVWLSIFFRISTNQFKKILEVVFRSFAAIAVVDFMFFGKDLGIISTDLFFNVYPNYSVKDKILNILVIIVITCLINIIWKRVPSFTKGFYVIITLSLTVVSLINIRIINKEISENSYLLEKTVRENEPIFSLSKTGKNVVIVSMDSMIGAYVPFIMAEKPELMQVYDGFTFYPNTLSSGYCTAIGSPGMLGGYEYTPYYSNMRSDITLEEKNYEYTTLMPRIFAEAGYIVTACDTPYAGYEQIPDMSEIDAIENVDGINTMGYYVDPSIPAYGEDIRERKFFWYSLFKVAPLFAQTTVYDGGIYYSSRRISDLNELYGTHFMESYEVMDNLSNLTEITDENINTFLFINNDMAHERTSLHLPDYSPSFSSTNGEEPGFRTDVEGNVFYFPDSDSTPSHYHVNMASLLLIGKWLEYLKEQQVYDNTRIIIVSDHGRSLSEFPQMGNMEIADPEVYNSILLVKDFYEHGYKESDLLMSNADTPTLAMEGIINNPQNPYTGNPINSELKENGIIMLLSSDVTIPPKENCQYGSEGQKWILVNENLFDKDNWSIYTE